MLNLAGVQGSGAPHESIRVLEEVGQDVGIAVEVVVEAPVQRSAPLKVTGAARHWVCLQGWVAEVLEELGEALVERLAHLGWRRGLGAFEAGREPVAHALGISACAGVSWAA